MNIKTPFKCYWKKQPETIYTFTNKTDTKFLCTWLDDLGREDYVNYEKESVFRQIEEGIVIVLVEDPLVTIPESEYHSLIEEVNMLQELVKELSAPHDTALEQQAETYRALNETLTRHESFQEGEDGVFTSRCEELLNTIDFLHEVYDDWKTNDYRAAVASAGSDAFKPISEYTLEDWKQALDEEWEFECRDGHTVKIDYINYGEDYPIVGDDYWYRNIAGVWYVGDTDSDDIVKRIR